jgi:hypothetical protein
VDWTLFAGLLTLVVGAVICFGGYRFFRFLMVLVGFGTGFVLGALGVSLFTKTPFLTGVWAWVAAIGAGLVLGVLAFPFYAAGVAVLGAAVGYLIGTGVMVYLSFGTGPITQGAGVGAALVLVILLFVLRVHRAIVMIYTALAGAAIILAGALFLAGQLPLDTKSAYDPTAVLRAYPLWLLLWGGAALVGLGAQWASRPRVPKPTPPAQPAPAAATAPTAPREPAPATEPPAPAAESTSEPPSAPPPPPPTAPLPQPPGSTAPTQPPGPAHPPAPGGPAPGVPPERPPTG